MRTRSKSKAKAIKRLNPNNLLAKITLNSSPDKKRKRRKLSIEPVNNSVAEIATTEPQSATPIEQQKPLVEEEKKNEEQEKIPTEEKSDFSFIASAFVIPKVDNQDKRPVTSDDTTSQEVNCGEDAFFIARKTVHDKQVCRVLGIADGVSGWKNHGADPSEMSRRLMLNARQISLSTPDNEAIQPMKVLDAAYQEILTQKQVTAGSTTACIVSLRTGEDAEEAVLEAANLGDSGFMVLRPRRGNRYQVMYKSKEQQHRRDCPFQMAVVPPHLTHLPFKNDQPSVANYITDVKVQADDLVFLATDGVLDNMFDQEITDTIRTCIAKATTKDQQLLMHECAKAVVTKAKEKSTGPANTTPFGSGKQDDITVIVAKVVKA